MPSRQVKGVKRELSNALIRLADSVCGFIRDVIEKNYKKKDEKLTLVYKKAIKEEVLIEV